MSEPTSRTGWIAKYGVPSLVLSVAVLIVQQQQQTFDRLQRILESGYQFYSSGRTALQYAGDGNRELSLLKIIGNAFPNVYCDVRQDIYERASKADKPGGVDKEGRKLIDTVEINALFEGLENASKPRRREAADNVMGAWSSAWSSKNEGKACPPLNNPSTEGLLVADAKGGASSPAPETGAAPEPPPPAATATPEPAPRDAAEAPAATSTGRAGATPAAPPPAPDAVPKVSLIALQTPMHVFFHIPADSPEGRDLDVSEGARVDLAPYNYQVMRGVARVPPKTFSSRPEVRYFGAEQEAAALQLKNYLNEEFRAEGLEFGIREIGYQYKGMPPQNIEVWVPNSPVVQQRIQAQAPAQRAQQTVQQPPVQSSQ